MRVNNTVRCRVDVLKHLHWMARRYADGRATYATSFFNDLTRELLRMGVKLCDRDNIIWVRDAGGRQYDGLTKEEAVEGTPEAKGLHIKKSRRQ